MTRKDYLETRRRQDVLLTEISDSAAADEAKVDELLALQEDCDAFERTAFHQGYREVALDLEPHLLVKIIRLAHEARMNVSDFVCMVLDIYMDEDIEFTWTTNLEDAASATGIRVGDSPLAVSGYVRRKLGWESGDFIRITAPKEGLTLNKLDIE